MLTAITLTKNEEKNISKTIKSILWCDEIIIIDDYSIDKTIKKIKSFKNKKIKIYKKHLNDDFADQRNFGLSVAKGDWVLFIDADEIIPKALKKEIQHSISNKKHTNIDGFYLKRSDYFLHKKIRFGETGNIKLLRLARKGSGKFKRKVHEYWNIKGTRGELKNPILHFPHKTISEFIVEINQYSSLHSLANKREGKTTNLIKIALFPVGKFLVNFLFKLGFLDGPTGFIMSTMMSFHSFLSWSKQWTD